jgi:hypothetical protein
LGGGGLPTSTAAKISVRVALVILTVPSERYVVEPYTASFATARS